jgi:hypothetical protein
LFRSHADVRRGISKTKGYIHTPIRMENRGQTLYRLRTGVLLTTDEAAEGGINAAYDLIEEVFGG